MFKWAMIGLGLCFVLLVCAGYVKRANWIDDKIAALSAPASLVYAADNAALRGLHPALTRCRYERDPHLSDFVLPGQ